MKSLIGIFRNPRSGSASSVKHMGTRRAHARGKRDVENARKSMRQGNAKAKQRNVPTAKGHTAHGFMDVQFVNKRRNKGNHYGINYPTSTYRDDYAAWNIAEQPPQK